MNYTFSSRDFKYALKLYRGYLTAHIMTLNILINTYILRGQGLACLIQCYTSITFIVYDQGLFVE